MRRAIVDARPLVAFLDRAEQHHPWVIERIDELQPPLLVCRDRPMSLTDACIVRMAEIHDQYAVSTLDSDFMVYRKHGHEPLTLRYPAHK
jgi:uncharacterized protein